MPTLQWIGKEKVFSHHLDVPLTTLISALFSPELNKAYKKLDKAVGAAYGFTPRTHQSETAVVAGLMEMWRGMA